MRPPRIDVPARAARLPMQAASRRKHEFKAPDGSTLKRPGIQGFAAIHNTTFVASGRYVYFREGCFWDSIYDGSKKRLLLDHDDGKQVGSTDLGLEFASTTGLSQVNGLAFRMPIDRDNPDSELIYDTITNLDRPCVSVGITIEEKQTIVVDGSNVDIILKAKIDEISLVKEGAVPGTNASVVDLEHEDPWLFFAARSSMFALDKGYANLTAGAHRLVEKIQDLLSRPAV